MRGGFNMSNRLCAYPYHDWVWLWCGLFFQQCPLQILQNQNEAMFFSKVHLASWWVASPCFLEAVRKKRTDFVFVPAKHGIWKKAAAQQTESQQQNCWCRSTATAEPISYAAAEVKNLVKTVGYGRFRKVTKLDGKMVNIIWTMGQKSYEPSVYAMFGSFLCDLAT